MAKYNKERVRHICSLISKDSYTIPELCSLSGIDEATYHRWLNEKSEFSEAVMRAREGYDRLLVAEAKKSLMKKITGYTVQEKKTTFMDVKEKDETGKFISKPKIKEQTVTDKTFQPDAQSIMFALTNKAPAEYKNRINTELTGKDGKDLIPDRPITMKEAKKFLEQITGEI